MKPVAQVELGVAGSGRREGRADCDHDDAMSNVKHSIDASDFTLRALRKVRMLRRRAQSEVLLFHRRNRSPSDLGTKKARELGDRPSRRPKSWPVILHRRQLAAHSVSEAVAVNTPSESPVGAVHLVIERFMCRPSTSYCLMFGIESLVDGGNQADCALITVVGPTPNGSRRKFTVGSWGREVGPRSQCWC